jgi:hypothetical protein
VFIDSICPWHTCEKGHLRVTEPGLVTQKKLEVRINGVEVVDFASNVALNKNGQLFPTDQFPFEIEVKVNEPGSFVKLNAIIAT